MKHQLIIMAFLASVGVVNVTSAVAKPTEPTPPVGNKIAQCEPKEPAPPVGDLRPTQRWWCSYDTVEARNRIIHFFNFKDPTYKVEDVERTLGIPDMVTTHDDVRQASYMAEISGPGGWWMHVWVRESFFPLNGLPAKFIPGLHPTRLDAFENSDRRIDIGFKIASVPGRTEEDCERIFSFVAAARVAGWTDAPQAPPLDFGRWYPLMISLSGRHFSEIQPFGPECLTQLMFWEDPKPTSR